MSVLFSPEFALTWSTRLVAIGIVLDTLESLYCWREFQASGMLSWPWLCTLRTRRAFLRHRWFNWLFGYPVVLGIVSLRGGGALCVFIDPFQHALNSLGFTAIFMASLLMHLRSFPVGFDSSHGITLVITGALLFQCLAPTSQLVTNACLWFIAVQSCLSYATAGWLKLRNRSWRSGDGLFHVMNVPMLGAPPPLAPFLRQHLWLGKTLNWGTMAMECAFPLVLVVGRPYCWLFLAWGVLFHLSIAILLGFNKFLWAWLATYPAIVYVGRT